MGLRAEGSNSLFSYFFSFTDSNLLHVELLKDLFIVLTSSMSNINWLQQSYQTNAQLLPEQTRSPYTYQVNKSFQHHAPFSM